MAEQHRGPTKNVNKNDVSNSPYLQKLEAALDIRPLMDFMEKVVEKDASSEKESSFSDSHISEDELSIGDKIINGVVTSKEERQEDRTRLYNFDNMRLDDERIWLRNVLLSDSASDDSDADAEVISEDYLKRMLRDHLTRKKYAAKYHRSVNNNIRYKYYSSGLLSKYDRWPSLQRECALAAIAKQKRNKINIGGGARPRAPRAPPPPLSSEKEDWDDISIKEEQDDSDRGLYIAINSRSTARSKKRAAAAKKPEVLAARRRKLWQLMVKKEMGKVQRTRTAAHKDILQNCKRMATLCTKYHRQKAMQSQKNMKETIWRCKRLTREMQSYWKRYDKVERETRKRMEKEAEEQRKMDVELIEAKRQQRKLNFLITQTELYAHFMSRKVDRSASPTSQLKILSHLDEEKTPKHLLYLDSYDVEAMKERAARNAAEAFNADRARTKQFDRNIERVTKDNEGLPSGEHEQPGMFRGTLKGYQLKGMNWLANLYDQGISGILADEMGLGKTVQCIAFLCHVAERLGVWGPFLVVSPASTLHNWQQEMQRFIPDFKVVPYWGSPNERKILRQFWERKDLHTREAAFHVVITSYQLVVSDLKYLNRVKWQYMILDEAQAIKSSASLRWKLLLSFSCRNRLLLSGTPIQNSMAELWALLHFIMPTLFDSHDEFNEWFSKDIESHAENKTAIDEKHLSRLHMILKPFMLRRIKKDVENELSDKIEVMVYCPLTTRQKRLYIALKKKIKIEDLLHFSASGESGQNTDKNFTSNLMNLVMQFRKVCNHPELFERRDVKSPLFMKCEEYVLPTMITENCFLPISFPSKNHLFYNKFSIFTAEYIYRNLFCNKKVEKTFSFTRFIDLSPQELCNITIGNWLLINLYVLSYRQTYERIFYKERWKNIFLDKCDIFGNKNFRKYQFIICPNSNTIKRSKTDGNVWNDLLFTNNLNVNEPMIFTHSDHHIFSTPETMEHRLIRSKHSLRTNIAESISFEPIRERDHLFHAHHSKKSQKFGDKILVKKLDNTSESSNLELVPEFSHRPLPPQIRVCQPTSLPLFLFSSVAKVVCGERRLYSCSRAAAYRWTRKEKEALRATALVPLQKPPVTASHFIVPDKQALVTDAGKLNVLDGLLKRLKSQGHRVLIYSQMTKMIDLLEEYMWHRKHKYMRLDGSSKISARRDMVADFQARTDIFVFLLSTRAGGLGINLTAADTVIFYDSDWNPTVDQQAMDRAHRLGQTKQVTVYRLICKGSIEERIMQRAREKSEIQRMVISGGNFKPDTLKPKEVVSLLLDDEELEMKYRQRTEERRLLDENRSEIKAEKERKRKMYGLSPKGGDIKRVRGTAGSEESRPCSPSASTSFDSASFIYDDNSNEGLVIDVDNSNESSTQVVTSGKMKPKRVGGRRGRPRGSCRRLPNGSVPPSTGSSTASMSLASSQACAAAAASTSRSASYPLSSSRKGPGRSRVRTVARHGQRKGGGSRTHKGPLSVPLGTTHHSMSYPNTSSR